MIIYHISERTEKTSVLCLLKGDKDMKFFIRMESETRTGPREVTVKINEVNMVSLEEAMSITPKVGYSIMSSSIGARQGMLDFRKETGPRKLHYKCITPGKWTEV